MAKPRLKEHKTPHFSWVYFSHPTEMEIRELAHRFKFEALDLKDILPPIQRPKLIERENYLFMILLFPIYNRETGRIHSAEVDFFVGKNLLVTASSEDIVPLRELFASCSKKRALKSICDSETPGELIYEILSRLEQYCFPISTHINNDVDKVENEIFNSTHKQETINEVLRIKTNIVNFRKSMNRHTRVIQKFLNKAPRFFATARLGVYFKDLVERSEDLWQMLENYQNTIDAIHESHLSLLNYRSNVIMQVFTIFMTIIFIMELVISLIDLSTQIIPFDTKPWQLATAITGLVLIVLAVMAFFRKKKWI